MSIPRIRNRTSLFLKRTGLLLIPHVLSLCLLSWSSNTGFGKSLFVPLTNLSNEDQSISKLFRILSSQPLPEGMKSHGDMVEFSNGKEKYEITQLQPLNHLIFGDRFGFMEGEIVESNVRLNSTPTQLAPKLKVFKYKDTLTYQVNKSDFAATKLKDKGEWNIVIQMELTLEGQKKYQTTSVIDLSQAMVLDKFEVPILRSQKENETSSSTYIVAFDKGGSSDKFQLKIESKNTSQPSPIQKVDVKNIYVAFTNKPFSTFEQLFSTIKNVNIDDFTSDAHRIRRIFLDRWVKKNGTSTTSDAQFTFDTSNGFWKSVCVDPYKISGFIDKEPQQLIPGSRVKSDSKDDSKPYVEQQSQVYEEFSPWTSDIENPFAIEPYTTATPCGGLEPHTKEELKKYSKSNGGGKPNQAMHNHGQTEYINWNLMPDAIKQQIDGSSSSANRHSKIIQGTFRPSYARSPGDGNTVFEDAQRVVSSFDLKIEKSSVQKVLIEHQKLKAKDTQDTSKRLNQVDAVSTQLQVSMPYTLSIYDPTENYLKKQRVNLDLMLDLRAIYNQSQIVQDFLTYNIRENTLDSKSKLNGKIIFSAGLFWDVDGNLTVRLLAQTKGFLKDVNGAQCKPRQRHDKWSSNQTETCKQQTWINIPPFIVLEMDEDPRISSFYTDRRSKGVTYSSSTSSGSDVTNLSSLKNKLDKLDKLDITFTKYLDQANNAEVYFDRIDAADPVAIKRQEALGTTIGKNNKVPTLGSGSSNYLASYYIPRRNYGELSIPNTEKLKTLELDLVGSSTLGGEFFSSLHYGTNVTYCSSEKESQDSSLSQDCADGKKYSSQEKDQPSSKANDKTHKKISIDFDSLKSTNSASTKTFNFFTVINVKKDDKNKFDTIKRKLEFVMKKDARNKWDKDSSETTHVPTQSFLTVWYSLDLWWDASKNNLCYYTKVTPISYLAKISDQDPNKLKNEDAVKTVGAAGKAGFQVSSVTLKYQKS